MIISMKPISLVEAKEMAGNLDEKRGLDDYFRKFIKTSKENATKLEEELRGLKNDKIREEHVVKIVDFLPKDAEELHKIFHDTSLDEQEVATILGIISRY